MTNDPFNLNRFVDAQDGVFNAALTELRVGRKLTHWMWFVFPQMRGLGMSPMAKRYGIMGLEEARPYLAHPVLGPRLEEATQAVLDSPATSLHVLFGSPDDLKFQSSMTLFDAVRPDAVFAQALERLCEGRGDPRTLELLGQ